VRVEFDADSELWVVVTLESYESKAPKFAIERGIRVWVHQCGSDEDEMSFRCLTVDRPRVVVPLACVGDDAHYP